MRAEVSHGDFLSGVRATIAAHGGLRTAINCIHLQPIQVNTHPSRDASWHRLAPTPESHRSAADPAPAASGVAASATQRIVESITSAIVERRLMPGTKLVEQKIADIFKVSRTHRAPGAESAQPRPAGRRWSRRAARSSRCPASRRRARSSRCATCSKSAMVRQLCARDHRWRRSPQLRAHLRDERQAVTRADVARPHPAAGRFPCRAGAAAGQRGAGRSAARPAQPLVADLADVPVVAFGRRVASRTRSRSSTRSSSAMHARRPG